MLRNPMHPHDHPSTHAPLVAGSRYRSVERDLLEFIRTKIEPVRARRIIVDADTGLFEAGLIDSIHILALIGFVEHRLDRRLDDEEIVMPHFRSVRSIVSAFFS